MATVINFKVSEYDNEVMKYINQLSNDNLYNIFNSKTDNISVESNGLYTAALRRISKQERIIFKYYLRKSVKRVNGTDKLLRLVYWYTEQLYKRCPTIEGQSLQISLFHNDISDVFDYDDELFEVLELEDENSEIEDTDNRDYGTYAFILLHNGVYAGHIYAWIQVDPNYNYGVTNIIGIRSSFIELASRRCGSKINNIGNLFMNAIFEWTVNFNVNVIYKFLRVLHPIGTMPIILEKYGFVSSRKLDENNFPIMGNNIINAINWMQSNESYDFKYFDDVGSRYFDKYLRIQ